MPAKFRLGRVVATPGALDAFTQAREIPNPYLILHQSGDWGEIPPEDVQENELSLREGHRLLSAYTLSTGVKFWIITEADRSVTTVLLPGDY